MFFKMGLKNKGQITLFIIIGLILLIALFSIFMLFNKEKSLSDKELQSIPDDFKPAADYIQRCMHDITLDAVKKMGAHGGYINPIDKNLTGFNLKYFPNSSDRSDVVSFTGSNDDLVPYYLHVPGKSSYTNYELSSSAPSIKEMENQIERQLLRLLPNCSVSLNNQPLLNLKIELASDKLIPKVLIKDEAIEIYASYPVNVSDQLRKIQLTDFSSKVNVPLKKYYDLALNLAQVQAYTQFQESFTTNLITYYSGLDKNALPPKFAKSDTQEIITWSGLEQQRRIDSLLSSYIPALNVLPEDYVYTENLYESEVEKAFFESLKLKIYEEDINEQITFFYRPASLSLKINPSKGDLIKPSSSTSKGNQFIPTEKSNTYKFSYDISYPVFIEIRALNEVGSELPEFSFLFAIETNVIENKPALAWMLGYGTTEWDSSSLSQTLINIDAEGNEIKIEPWISSKTLFCDESTWSSGNISLKLTDMSLNPLNKVSLIYSCGEYAQCYVGESDFKGEFNGNLPVCKGGTMNLVKEGYGSKSIEISTSDLINSQIGSYSLQKSMPMILSLTKLSMMKQYNRNDDWEWLASQDSLGIESNLDSDDQVVLSISSLDDEEFGFSSTIIFGRDGESNPEINLVPGRYSISASLLKYSGITIPANCSRFCESRYLGVLGCSQYTYIPEEPVKMEPAIWGGIELDEVIITDQDLKSGKLKLKVLELPDLKQSNPSGACLDALDEMGKIEEYSERYKSSILPEFN